MVPARAEPHASASGFVQRWQVAYQVSTLFLDGGTGKIDRLVISNNSGAGSVEMIQDAVTLGGLAARFGTAK